MSDQPEEIQFTQAYSLLRPSGEEALPVPVSQWRKFMERLRNYPDKSDAYLALGWGSIGVAVEAIGAAIAFPFSVSWSTSIPANGTSPAAIVLNLPAILTEGVFVTLGIAGLGIGLVTLWHGKKHSQDRADLRRIVVEDMEAFEALCRPISANKAG